MRLLCGYTGESVIVTGCPIFFGFLIPNMIKYRTVVAADNIDIVRAFQQQVTDMLSIENTNPFRVQA